LGLLGGLVLGLGVAIGRERSRPRVLSVADLQAATTEPVVEYLPASTASAEAVARRSLVDGARSRIVVTPLSWRSTEAARAVTDLIASAAARDGDGSFSVQLSEAPDTGPGEQVVLVVTSEEPLRSFVRLRREPSSRPLIVFVPVGVGA
jgi:hypothetical protein